MRPLVAAAVLSVLADHGAEAGRRRAGWLHDTELLPERGVALEWWAWERTSGERREAVLSVQTVVGLTDNFELAIPLDVAWRPNRGTELESAGLDLRWRLAPVDRARSGTFIPLLRAGARRLIAEDAARFDADAVLSIELPARLDAILDAGGVAVTGQKEIYLTFGAALGGWVAEELHVGVELYGEAGLADEERTWVSVGPDLSFTHGRFWITAACPVGIGAAPGLLPRVIWATAF